MCSPKYFLILSFLLAAFVSPVLAGDYTGAIHFSLDDLSFYKANGFDYVLLEDGVPSAGVGAPAVPFIQADVAIPWDAEMLNVHILEVVYQDLDRILDLVPMTEPQTVSGRSPGGDPFIKDPSIYRKDAFFPGTYGDVLASWDLVGLNFAKLQFHPVQYNPVTQKIRFATEIRFRLTWDDSSTPQKPPTFNMTESGKTYYTDYLQGKVLNPDAVSIPDYAGSTILGLSAGQYEHVIITPQAFEAYWTDLVDWHTRKGFPDIVVTREYIYANYSGTTNPQKIRNFVIDAHLTWGTRYFLIGADGGTGSLQIPYHVKNLLGIPRRQP